MMMNHELRYDGVHDGRAHDDRDDVRVRHVDGHDHGDAHGHGDDDHLRLANVRHQRWQQPRALIPKL